MISTRTVPASAGPIATGSTNKSWQGQVLQLLARHWFLKATGTMTFMVIFLAGYLVLQHHPIAPVTTMPFTLIDRIIGFQPQWIWLYASLWVYVSLPPALLSTRAELIGYATWMALTCLVAMSCFLLWPTAVPAMTVETWRYPAFAFLKAVDTTGNACPSLHVASALFSGMWLQSRLRSIHAPHLVRAVNALWCAGIIYSTMATRQHVFYDVAAGMALGLVGATCALHRLTPVNLRRYWQDRKVGRS